MNSQIELTILGIPVPKQSVKVGKRNGKNHFYQPEIIQAQKRKIENTLNDVLGDSHSVWNGIPICVRLTYVFPIPKGMSKKLRNQIESGETVYKTTKPDVGDNLNKLILDCLEGYVYSNDSEIVEIIASKVYGEIPRTEITLITDNNLLFYPKKAKKTLNL